MSSVTDFKNVIPFGKGFESEDKEKCLYEGLLLLAGLNDL